MSRLTNMEKKARNLANKMAHNTPLHIYKIPVLNQSTLIMQAGYEGIFTLSDKMREIKYVTVPEATRAQIISGFEAQYDRVVNSKEYDVFYEEACIREERYLKHVVDKLVQNELVNHKAVFTEIITTRLAGLAFPIHDRKECWTCNHALEKYGNISYKVEPYAPISVGWSNNRCVAASPIELVYLVMNRVEADMRHIKELYDVAHKMRNKMTGGS